MMVSIFGLLVLFGGGIAFLGLIVFAIASKKLWIIPAAGAPVFFGLIASGLFFGIVIPTAQRGATVQMSSSNDFVEQVGTVSHTVMQAPPNFNAYHGINSSSPVWIKIFVLLVIGSFVVGLIFRRMTCAHASPGFRRTLPVVGVILFLGVMFLFRVSVQHEHSQVDARTARDAAEAAITRQQFLITREQAAQQIRKQQQIAKVDIHAEMDQFDAPRIPIPPIEAKSPDASAAPAAPPAPAQPTAVAKATDKPAAGYDKSAAKSTQVDTKKASTASSQKRKKTDKSPASTDTKQSQLVAQSKSAEESSSEKDNASSGDKPATAAVANAEKSTARPAWVDESPKRAGNTRREVIATEEFATVDECYQAADIYLLLKAYQRMQQLAGRHDVDGPLPSLTFRDGTISADGNIIFSRGGYWADARLYHLNRLGINADYVRREIVAKDPKNNESREYVETFERSFGPMKKLYLQIEFTPSVDRELKRHWDAYERQERFGIVGVGAGSILGLLGLAFALLKIDTATKGYYTKRLFIGVPLAILGMFGLYAMLVEMGVDLPH